MREIKVATLSQNALQAATGAKNQAISNRNPSTPLNQSHDNLKMQQGVFVDSNPEQVLNSLRHFNILRDPHPRRDVPV